MVLTFWCLQEQRNSRRALRVQWLQTQSFWEMSSMSQVRMETALTHQFHLLRQRAWLMSWWRRLRTSKWRLQTRKYRTFFWVYSTAQSWLHHAPDDVLHSFARLLSSEACKSKCLRRNLSLMHSTRPSCHHCVSSFQEGIQQTKML